ncbi:MAG: transcriptional regulator [Lachnospiraceae bacterium]|nr:transcriptional regulator [Lachnospiraceae bacterium]
MTTLGMSGQETAACCGVSPSYFSRIKNGKRKLPENHIIWKILAEKASRIAREKGQQESLRQLTGSDEPDAVMAWLSADAVPKKQEMPEARVCSGERLRMAMSAAGLTAAMLGKAVGLDPSQISRIQNGSRSLRKDTPLFENICHVLLRKLEQPSKRIHLAGMMRCHEEDLPEGHALREWLCEWLYMGEEQKALSGLLSAIRALPYIEGAVTPDEEWKAKTAAGEGAAGTSKDPEEENESGCQMYKERSGLRAAAERFLIRAMDAGTDTLCFYSDEPMGWVEEDPAFLYRWKQLMMECAVKGIRISVIHNVDQCLSEMTTAVIKWMPLHLNGQVSSCYSHRPRGSRFVHTLFLAPGIACVYGSHVAGENGGLYHYSEEETALDSAQRNWDRLAGEVSPLVRVIKETGPEVKPAEAGEDLEIRLYQNSVTIRRLQEPRLSFVLSHPRMQEAFRDYLSL